MTIKSGEGWIINGYLSVVHVIHLDKFEELLQTTNDVFTAMAKSENEKKLFAYQLQKAYDRIESLKSTRVKRSINWIGSAWKWIAGNPDAADWDTVLQSEKHLVENNEQQYVINKSLFGTTSELFQKMNDLLERFNNKIAVEESEHMAKDAMNQLLAIKEDINEIVRACQLAKAGVVNTNLLNMEEIHQIVSEMESLPFSNEIEAIEYGKPSIYSNGTSLLYVLSMPKVKPSRYNRILLKSTISDGRQLDLAYNVILINHDDIFALKNQCSMLSNVSICAMSSLEKLSSKDCVAKILRGKSSKCTFRTNNETIVEQIEEDLIYLTNFKGNITSIENTVHLKGTYLVRIFNETINIGGRRFSNKEISNVHALPPLLSNVTEENRKVDIKFLHELHEKNIRHLHSLRNNLNLSLYSTAAICLCILVITITLTVLWRKIFGRIIPTMTPPKISSSTSN